MTDIVPEVKTTLTDEGEPRVVLAFVAAATGQIIVPLILTPEEARASSFLLVEAAEAIEKEAHITEAMRSHKYTEEEIGIVVDEVRRLRLAAVAEYATVEDSQDVTGSS